MADFTVRFDKGRGFEGMFFTEARNEWDAMNICFDAKEAEGLDMEDKFLMVEESVTPETEIKVGDKVQGKYKFGSIRGTVSKITKSKIELVDFFANSKTKKTATIDRNKVYEIVRWTKK